MDTLMTSIVGIMNAQTELKKYPSEQEKQEAMEHINSKTIASSCHNVLYLIGAIVSAGLIHWTLR